MSFEKLQLPQYLQNPFASELVLHNFANKLSSDFDLQKDLVQEMFIHLVRVEAELPQALPTPSLPFQRRAPAEAFAASPHPRIRASPR